MHIGSDTRLGERTMHVPPAEKRLARSPSEAGERSEVLASLWLEARESLSSAAELPSVDICTRARRE